MPTRFAWFPLPVRTGLSAWQNINIKKFGNPAERLKLLQTRGDGSEHACELVNLDMHMSV